GEPKQRLSDASSLARRLRALDERRVKREEELAAAEKARKQEDALARYRRRRWWTAGLTAAYVSTLIAFWFIYFDLEEVYSSNLGALTALDRAAARAEKRGDFAE